MMEQIFVSSVQKELQAERCAVRDFVHGNDLLRQFFRVFLFDDLPPSDLRPDNVYLDEVALMAHKRLKWLIAPYLWRWRGNGGEESADNQTMRC